MSDPMPNMETGGTEEADNAAATDDVVDVETLRSYFLYKAFDVISKGSYKKMIVRSKELNDAEAVELYGKVQSVQGLVRGVTTQVGALHEYGKERLQRVCREVLQHVGPPCRVKRCWNICSISGIRSADCVDLTRAGKSDAVITVHRKFSHFVLMLWVVAKFEHLCKMYARQWIAKLPEDEAKDSTVAELCQRFQREADVSRGLHAAFCHAHAHVTGSLESYRRVPAYEIGREAPRP